MNHFLVKDILQKLPIAKKCQKITLFYEGMFNFTYKIITYNKKQYALRISKQNFLHHWNHDLYVLKSILKDQLLWYDNNGNYLKQWIKGKTFKNKFFKCFYLKLILNAIEQFHMQDINYEKLIEHDYFAYLSKEILTKIAYLNQNWTYKYFQLINNLNNKQYTFSHNDINFKNIIINRKSLFLIDYEWVRFNHYLFDYGSLIIEFNLNKKIIKKIATYLNINNKLIYEWIFIVSYYNLSWCLFNSSIINTTSMINKYKKYLNIVFQYI